MGWFGFNIIPREMRFYDMFEQMAATITRAAGKFLDLVTSFDQISKRCLELKQEEEIADEMCERIIKSLDRSFITPFDREDIHQLANKMDDILDNMEETAYRFQEFRIDRPTPEAVELARIIKDSCGHLEQAIKGCRNMKKPGEIHRHLLEISQLENEADKIYRAVDSALFADPPDILTLIKLRELYEWLEATVDTIKNVAEVISEIVIKGS